MIAGVDIRMIMKRRGGKERHVSQKWLLLEGSSQHDEYFDLKCEQDDG